MATLTGELISETYDSLLKVTDNNTITGVKKRITDGFGNEIPLQLSSTDIEIDGTLILSSLTDLEVATKFLSLKADNSVAYRTASEVLSDIGGASASDLSLYVPYTGATSNLNLGANSLSAQDITVAKNGLKSIINFPAAVSPGSDNGFIEHEENPADTAIMRFSVSDNETNDYFVFGNTQGLVFNERFKITSDGEITANKIQNATTDTDKFLVSDSGTIKYRTGAELLSDIGGASASGYVPYTGATANLQLGEYGLSGGFVTFDTTPTSTPTSQGTLYWDDSKSTVALIMNGTIQHIGQDSYYYAKNSTGSSIPKGTAVRFAGTDGASGHILITPMLANGSVPSSYYMGITSEAIANGGFGQVVAFGELAGFNTSGYSAGALLYVSTTVAGGFQTTVPIAPNNIILAAATLNSKNNGDLIVRATLGSNINNDEGVRITGATTGDLLQLQSGGLWENKTVANVMSNYVTLNGTQTITGAKTFNTSATFTTSTTNAITASTTSGTAVSGTSSNYIGLSGSSTSGKGLVATSSTGIGAEINSGSGVGLTVISQSNDIALFYGASSALKVSISQAGNITANSFIKSGGTSSQFLKADGSIDSNTYALSSALSGYLPLSGGTLTGALFGTTASFTSSIGLTSASSSSSLTSTTNGIEISVDGSTSSNKNTIFKIGSSETMRIDASGRLGIGTTSPELSLDIAGFGGLVYGGAGRRKYLTTDSLANSPFDNMIIKSLGGSGGWRGAIQFQTSYNGGSVINAMSIASNTDGTTANVGIGTTSPATKLEVIANANTFQMARFENTNNTSGNGVLVTNLGSNCNNTSSYHLIAATGGADKFYLYGNGTYTTVSDSRLKKDISKVTDNYLEKVLALNIVNYHWNDQNENDALEFGMIAQEVEELIPSIVHEGREDENGNKYKGIQASVLPYILIKAIQELTEKVKQLENK